ncbi:twin-arginine translocase subunit TatC [Desulfovibrio oxyclinae]|uniref:twin-arginine translocase subunit TatC n=1 Tax=Desulfovibrio oxyclinae TaxID=63560 RepID=UPI00036A6588|nr:twin-arginine translocase subunit TatC [Desulfovibrio oxyclinae]
MSSEKDDVTPESGVTPEDTDKNTPEASEEASGGASRSTRENGNSDSGGNTSASEGADIGDGETERQPEGDGSEKADDPDFDPSLDEESQDDEDEDEEEASGQMTLLEHLGELRQRMVRCVLAIIVGMLACYAFAEQMFDILMKPMKEVLKKVAAKHMVLPLDFFTNLETSLAQALKGTDFKYFEKLPVFVEALQDSMSTVMVGGHFQYTYPAEAFFSHIKIAIVAGIFLMSPYLFAQIWGFIAPGLYSHERKYVVPMAIISAMFFVGGGMFGYFVVFPFGFDFFASFASTEIAFTPKLNEYLSFCLKLLFAFGVVFELPLFIFFLARLGIVSSRGLRKKQKYAVLVAFVISSILTPPDPFTQCLMAGPLIILYELGIWVAYLFGKNEKRHQEKLAEEAEAEQEELEAAARIEDAALTGDSGESGK